MPLKLWDEVLSTAAYFINRSPSRVIRYDTPICRLSGTTPDFSQFKVFVCACWPNLRPCNTLKLAFWSKYIFFLGYNNVHNCYKCLKVNTGHAYISRDVIFGETLFLFFELHLNVEAQLCSDILFLPPTLINPAVIEHVVDGHVVDP
jgi:hypothetical protein